VIPLRDVLRSRTTPLILYSIIAANIGVFFYELSLSPGGLQRFIFQLGLVPWKLTTPEVWSILSPLQQILPLFSSMFLHGGWIHIIGNLWVLHVFGDNVEDRMGHHRFAAFYIAAGLVSIGLHLATAWGSKVPVIGASGAIAGVMGAYLVYYPNARIVTLLPVLLFVVIEVPAYFFLIFWFLLQFLNGTFALVGAGDSAAGIAWWAHVGGFLFGVAAARAFQKPAPPKPDLSPLARRFFS